MVELSRCAICPRWELISSHSILFLSIKPIMMSRRVVSCSAWSFVLTLFTTTFRSRSHSAINPRQYEGDTNFFFEIKVTIIQQVDKILDRAHWWVLPRGYR